MSELNIVIVVEGGVIQSVIADRSFSGDLRVIDYDADGADDFVEVPQEGGGTERALLWHPHISINPKEVSRLMIIPERN